MQKALVTVQTWCDEILIKKNIIHRKWKVLERRHTYFIWNGPRVERPGQISG
jgi:hypothetical protein